MSNHGNSNRGKSNRAIRRAAERQALKAARESARQLIVTNTGKAIAATASIVGGDNELAQSNATKNGSLDDQAHNLESPEYPTAFKSTGPRTQAGKENSSRNAVKHGLCAVKTLILPNESMTDFSALEAEWFRTYCVDPSTDKDPVKSELIRTAVRAQWFFKRAERNYSDVESALVAETPSMADWTEEQHKKLGRVLRYRTANANILAKHRKELETHIKARAAECAQYQKSREKDERLNMAKDRLEIFRQKNKPFDLAEELENMKKKAIQLGFRKPDPESNAQ